MMHRTREFQVSDVATPAELAEKLTQHDWCPCQAFAIGGLLFLNDSTGPDGAQEYGVVRGGTQIESVTFGWMNEPDALDTIKRLLDGTLGAEYAKVLNKIVSPEEHGRCYHCA